MKIIKTALLFSLLIAISLPEVAGQSKRIAAADDAFNSFQYNLAATRYKKAFSKTKSRPEKDKISFQMAESYRMMNSTKKAEANYRRIIKSVMIAAQPEYKAPATK